MSLETRETKLFRRDIPGFCRDIPEVPEKFEKQKFVFNSRPLKKNKTKTESKFASNRREFQKLHAWKPPLELEQIHPNLRSPLGPCPPPPLPRLLRHNTACLRQGGKGYKFGRVCSNSVGCDCGGKKQTPVGLLSAFVGRPWPMIYCRCMLLFFL